MDPNMQKIERMRAEYESELMAIDGVVAVSIGLCGDGRPCLKIGTSGPVEQVRSRLPKGLDAADIEVENIGEIRAQ